MSWQPPSEDWQSALEQPEDWQAQLERRGIPKEPLWSREPVAATPAPAAHATVAPPVADPVARPWQPAPHSAGTRARTAPNAIGSFVIGLIGLWVWFLGPVAVYQGLKARRAIDRSSGQLGGRTIATIGLVLGVLETVGLIISVIAIGLAVSASLD